MASVKTRFIVISDSHGELLDRKIDNPADVLIHCGDMTEESKLSEFKSSIQLLKSIDAPLKLVIAGNHNFTLDTPAFQKKLDEVKLSLEDETVKREYGSIGEARALFDSEDVKSAGIVFLDEGTHSFTLANGARLTVYASPYTPSTCEGAFQYYTQDEHEWDIKPNTDLVITHGPPKGVMDYTSNRQRVGSESLFAAIAKSQPRMHCFGHIHECWGAKKVTWRSIMNETPTHIDAIDNDESSIVENLSTLQARKFDSPEIAEEKAEKLRAYQQTGYCTSNEPLQQGSQTLFVNAAIQGCETDQQQLPWLVEMDIATAEEKNTTPSKVSTHNSKKRRADDEVDSETPLKQVKLLDVST